MNTGAFEQKLVRNAAGDGLETFNQLVLQYQDAIFRYTCALVGEPDLAEDITQESFIKAFRNIKSFHGGSFRAWLLKIVTNTAYDHLRQSRRISTISIYGEDEDGDEYELPLWIVDRTALVEETVQKNEEARYLYRLLDQLPVDYRAVITLIDLDDLDYTEAAEILRIPLGTVKSRLARARMQLKEKILNRTHVSFTASGRLTVAQGDMDRHCGDVLSQLMPAGGSVPLTSSVSPSARRSPQR